MLLHLGEKEEHLFLSLKKDIVGILMERKEVAWQPPNISILYKKRYISEHGYIDESYTTNLPGSASRTVFTLSRNT